MTGSSGTAEIYVTASVFKVARERLRMADDGDTRILVSKVPMPKLLSGETS